MERLPKLLGGTLTGWREELDESGVEVGISIGVTFEFYVDIVTGKFRNIKLYIHSEGEDYGARFEGGGSTVEAAFHRVRALMAEKEITDNAPFDQLRMPPKA